jgi:tryptophan aminotransferase
MNLCIALFLISSDPYPFVCRFKLLIGSDADEGDSESIIRTNAVERGVLALPGTVFLPDGRKTAYVRASFSLLAPEEVEEAMKRLRDVILDARGSAAT